MSTPSTPFATARHNMMDNQLRPNKITDKPLLAQFSSVPRELFVLPEAKSTAYVDAPQAIAPAREMYSPMVLARLIQELNIQPEENILIVAGGTGYSAAVLSGLGANVTMVEDDAHLATQAAANLKKLNLNHVTILAQEPEDGAHAQTPYNAILMDAPAAHIPPRLISQLAEGGRLACVKSGKDGVLEATLATRHGNALVETPLFETKGTILAAFAEPQGFVF